MTAMVEPSGSLALGGQAGLYLSTGELRLKRFIRRSHSGMARPSERMCGPSCVCYRRAAR
jgi:hypothetical protein